MSRRRGVALAITSVPAADVSKELAILNDVRHDQSVSKLQSEGTS
jgi:hypothetical protein